MYETALESVECLERSWQTLWNCNNPRCQIYSPKVIGIEDGEPKFHFTSHGSKTRNSFFDLELLLIPYVRHCNTLCHRFQSFLAWIQVSVLLRLYSVGCCILVLFLSIRQTYGPCVMRFCTRGSIRLLIMPTIFLLEYPSSEATQHSAMVDYGMPFFGH